MGAIAEATARQWLREHLRFVDPNRHAPSLSWTRRSRSEHCPCRHPMASARSASRLVLWRGKALRGAASESSIFCIHAWSTIISLQPLVAMQEDGSLTLNTVPTGPLFR